MSNSGRHKRRDPMQDEFTTAMHIVILKDTEGDEVIYPKYEYMEKRYGKAKALEEMGLEEPPQET